MEPVDIPTRCDDPVHFLIWSADELLPIMIGLVFGMAIGQAMIGMVVGMVVTNFYKKYADSHPTGYIVHAMYWIGVLPTRAKLFINPFIRNLLP